MKNSLLLFFALSILSTKVFSTDYYVSKMGNNSNNGKTLETPFLTIQKASSVAHVGDNIFIMGGVYREEVDIKVDGITFAPYNNEQVIINGADLLTNWTIHQGSTFKTTMNWNMNYYGTNQIFCDGKMIELARWPDQLSQDIVVPTNAMADEVTRSGNLFIIKDNDFNEPDGRWVGAKIWVNLSRNGYDGQGWTGFVSATNAANHTITVDFGESPRLGNQPWSVGQNTEYFLFDPTKNAVENSGGVDALLSNGEWWKDGQILYVKTSNGQSPALDASSNNLIEAKRRHFAFTSNNASSAYKIMNLDLYACSINTDPGAKNIRTLRPMHDIVLDGLKVKYVSHQTFMSGNWQDEHYNWSGIILGGSNNVIQNCKIEFSATSALSVYGYGNKIINNTIANTNYMCSNAGAINTGFYSRDMEFYKNTIFNTTMMAINFKYSKNSSLSTPGIYRIHHNTIYNFMRRSGDSGAIDIVGEDGQGIRIDHNLIYNRTPIIGNMVHGVYLDFGGGPGIDIGNFIVDHNVILDVPAPILINNIKYVEIYNNTLMSNMEEYCIVNYNGGKRGVNVKIYNNIMSKGPNTNCCDGVDLALADVKNNITNAHGEMLNKLFVDPINMNYKLIASATEAIDMGISVGIYDENVVGLPDLGAFEYEPLPEDNQSPTTPENVIVSHLEAFKMDILWNISLDNIKVSAYEVYVNDKYYTSVATNLATIENLIPLTNYSIKVRARDEYGNKSEFSESVQIKTPSAGPGFVLLEMWKGVQGTQIVNIPLDKAPTETSFITKLELPTDKLDYYGVRIKGYILPTITGDYTFYIASDDFGEFWLSPDIKLANKEKIAYHVSWTNSREWFKFPTQKSVVKKLIAGEKYCFEILMKEGNAGDNLAVGWTTPINQNIEIIGGQNIEAYNADNEVLDVSFVSFSGISDNRGNVLSWITASESNNQGFNVMKSVDGINFNKVAFLSSKSLNGNSNSNLNYQFIDKDQSLNAYYYLEQVDLDFSVKKSNIIFIKQNTLEGQQFAVYPNPFTFNFTIVIDNDNSEKYNLRLIDISGKIVHEQNGYLEKGRNLISSNVYNLLKGIYILNIKNDKGKILLNRKVVKN